MTILAKRKWGAQPKAAVVDPVAADAFVTGGAEQPPAQEAKVPTPEVPEGKAKQKRLTIDVDAALHSALKVKAAQRGLTIADVARDLLKDWVEG